MSNKLSEPMGFWDLKDEDKDLTMFIITDLTLTKKETKNMVFMAIKLKRKVGPKIGVVVGGWGSRLLHGILSEKLLIFSKKIKCSKQPKKQNQFNFYFSLLN